MHCCRMGLFGKEKDFIVVGSHTGYLSIYYPTPSCLDIKPTDNDVESDNFDATINSNEKSQPNDLVLEMKLPVPIIGITSGQFIG